MIYIGQIFFFMLCTSAAHVDKLTVYHCEVTDVCFILCISDFVNGKCECVCVCVNCVYDSVYLRDVCVCVYKLCLLYLREQQYT